MQHSKQISKSSLLNTSANQHLSRTLKFAIIAACSSIAGGHGLLVKPISKNAGDTSTSSEDESAYFTKSAFGIIDKAWFDGDMSIRPWTRPGYFDHILARDLIDGYPQTLHPCGCNAGRLNECAGLGQAAGFGETTLGPGLGTPPTVVPPEWVMGSHQEVGWNAYANHGGGYLYMLCKKTDFDYCRDAHLPNDLTNVDQGQTDAYLECVWDCFESTTLEWVADSQKLQYQDDACTYVRMNDLAKLGKNGHVWRWTPIPDFLQVELGGDGECQWWHVNEFSNTKAEAEFIESFGTDDVCDSGSHAHNPKEWQIMDKIIVPTDIVEGEYLLSWRWDAYMADQMWTNCADVKIVSEAGTLDGSVSSEPDCIPGQTPQPTPALPTSPTTPSPTPVCTDIDLQGNLGENGLYTCDFYQERGGEDLCDHQELGESCCFCGGGDTGSGSAPTPTCTDNDLPHAWGHGGVYDCSYYEQHGGKAYCAHEAISMNCCFCTGGGPQSN